MVQFTIELGIEGANALFYVGAAYKGAADSGGTFNYNVDHLSGFNTETLTAKKTGYDDCDTIVYNQGMDVTIDVAYGAYDQTPPGGSLYPHG
jgi:hypothetical protein